MKRQHFKSPKRTSIAIAPAAAGLIAAFLVHALHLADKVTGERFLTFHIILEVIDSFIAILIFFLASNTLKRELTGYTLLFACSFLGVALTETMHILGHTGIPPLVPTFVRNQITYFNLLSHLLQAIALNIVAFQVWPKPVNLSTKYALLASSVVLIFALEALGIRHIELLPTLFSDNVGFTWVKKGADAVLASLFLTSAYGAYKNAHLSTGTDFRLLFNASCLMTFSQLCVVTESIPFSELHIMGQVLSSVSGWIIFRAIFVANFEVPFLKLDRSERMLRNALKARDDFLSIAGHELRTPLTPLRAQFQLAEKELKQMQAGQSSDCARLLKYTTNIETNLERLTRLVNNLIDVATVRSGGSLTLKLRHFDLADRIRSLLEHMEPEFKASGSPVRYDAPHPVEGDWDPIRIEQLLTNLLSNSLKYARGAPIWITLEMSGATSTLRYRDQGGGIPADKMREITESSLRPTTEVIAPGLGLGIYMAKKIVEAHQGRMSIQSEPGRGTSILITFPMRGIGANALKHA